MNREAISFKLLAISRNGRWFVVSLLFAALMLGVVAPVWAGGAQASVSARETQVGVPVVLQIVIENAEAKQLPSVPQIPGVRVRSAGGPSQSSQTTIINGAVQSRSTLTYAYELTPLKEGRFTIPAIEVQTGSGVEKTAPISIVVSKSQTKDRLFVEIKGNRKKVYVGETLTLTLQIWIKPAPDMSGGFLPSNSMWSLVDFRRSQWGSFIEPLQRLLEQNRALNGREELRKDSQGSERSYYLYELKQTIQANRPGRLTVDDINVILVYPDRLRQTPFGGLEIAARSMLTAQPVVEPIEVLPVPTKDRPAYYSGAVGTYSVQAAAKPTEVAVGDPITLTLTVSGTGNLQELQPPPLAQLPELTGHFRIPTDPLAGEVAPDGKRFTISIRATSHAVTEVPAIPFAYFDPQQERFVTVRTQPIPLKVKPADKLAMSQIVDSTGGHAPVANRLTEFSGGILANYTGMDEVLAQQAFVPGLGVWVMLLLPPFGFVVSWTLRRRSERLRTDVGFARKRRARRQAVGRLRQIGSEDASQAAAVVSSAVGQYIADRCNLPVGGMTRSAVVEQLKRCGARAEAVATTDELMEECEGIHYAGTGTRSARELQQMAVNCINRLEREKW